MPQQTSFDQIDETYISDAPTFFGAAPHYSQTSAQPQANTAGIHLNLNHMRPVYNERLSMERNLMANALLRKYDWEQISQKVVEYARSRLVGAVDLLDNGLYEELADLGVLYSTYEKVGDMSAADIDMGAETQGEEDRAAYTPVQVPIPVYHKGFRFNLRHLTASRRNGSGVQMAQVTAATRRVRDAIEGVIFNGTGAPTVDGNTIYGYTSHPDRNTGSATGDWGTVNNIFTTVTNMIAAAEADGFYGPYGLYVAPTQYAQTRNRYTDGSGQTAVKSLIDNIDQLRFIHPGDLLADGNVVLVTLSDEVVDLAVAQEPTVVQWQSLGGMVEHFKVMAVMAPRIKSDSAGKCGIVHFTGA